MFFFLYSATFFGNSPSFFREIEFRACKGSRSALKAPPEQVTTAVHDFQGFRRDASPVSSCLRRLRRNSQNVFIFFNPLEPPINGGCFLVSGSRAFLL